MPEAARGGPKSKNQYVVVVSDLLSGERDAYGPHNRTSADNAARSLMENLRVIGEADQVKIDVAPLMAIDIEKTNPSEEGRFDGSRVADQI